MTISSPEREAKKVKIAVDRNPVETSFEKWAKPGHFSRTLAKGPNTTTWIWNLHADAHDFDSHTSDLEEISRKVFSAHFGQLGVIFIWLSGMYFHGARFSNYEAWLSDPVHIKPSAQVVWPVVGQEILNGDVGGGFQGIQITSGFFQLWRASGITSELQLYSTAIGGLVMAAAMFFAGWFHYHKAAPKLEWFQNVESMLNHHLAGLLGLGSLGWAGHQIHISLPVNKLLDAGVDPKEIPLPHDFILNRQIMADLYPSFGKGLAPFFTLQWNEYSDFLTFNGGLNPVTGGLWLSDTAHHHVAIAVLFLVAGHMYRTNWGIGHSIKEILESHKGPFTGEGHVGLYEILTTSWHAQLAINLALFGSLSIIVAHHMYAMPPYPYLATDYGTQLSLFTHHNWIGGFCIVGAGAHAAIFMVRDYDPASSYNNLLDRVIRHRDAIISHLNWVSIFLGFHSFGLYIHNDTMSALGRPQDMFSDTAIQLQPVFAQWIQNTHFAAPQFTAPNALAATSASWGGDVVAVGGKVAMMPIALGTSDFMVQTVVDHVKLRYMLGKLVINTSPVWTFFRSKLCPIDQFIINNFCFTIVEVKGTIIQRSFQIHPETIFATSAFWLLLVVAISDNSIIATTREAKSLSSFCILFDFLNRLKMTNNQESFNKRYSTTFLRPCPLLQKSGRHFLKFYASFQQCYLKNLEKNVANRKNLVIKANQPETDFKSDSSETTREASFDFSDYYKSLPQHKKAADYSPDFLAWFIGFFEADGYYHSTQINSDSRSDSTSQMSPWQIDSTNQRIRFEITQKDPRVLHKIRSILGFGVVYKVENPLGATSNVHYRYFTSRKENVVRLLKIFNGNLVLTKRRKYFEQVLSKSNEYWNLNLSLKPWATEPSLNNAWLSGFVDGDGGFYTNQGSGFIRGKYQDGSQRYVFKMKFYITQYNENPILLKIRDMFQSTNKLSHFRNQENGHLYSRLEISAAPSRLLILDYFKRFPLRTAKKIDFLRWERLHYYQQNEAGRGFTQKAARKLKKLLDKLSNDDL